MSFTNLEIKNLTNILASAATKPHLLNETLKMILEISLHSSTGVLLLKSNDFAILNELLKLFIKKFNNEIILSILINISASSELLNEQIVNNKFFMIECTKLCSIINKKQNEIKSNLIYLRSVQLLANISRHFSQKVLEIFDAHWCNYLNDIFGSKLFI